MTAPADKRSLRGRNGIIFALVAVAWLAIDIATKADFNSYQLGQVIAVGPAPAHLVGKGVASGEGRPPGGLEAVALQQQDQLPQSLVGTPVAKDADGNCGGSVAEDFGLVLGHQLVGQTAGVYRRGHHQQVIRLEAVLSLPVFRPGEVDKFRFQPQLFGQIARRQAGNLFCAPGGAEIHNAKAANVHKKILLTLVPCLGLHLL